MKLHLDANTVGEVGAGGASNSTPPVLTPSERASEALARDIPMFKFYSTLARLFAGPLPVRLPTWQEYLDSGTDVRLLPLEDQQDGYVKVCEGLLDDRDSLITF